VSAPSIRLAIVVVAWGLAGCSTTSVASLAPSYPSATTLPLAVNARTQLTVTVKVIGATPPAGALVQIYASPRTANPTVLASGALDLTTTSTACTSTTSGTRICTLALAVPAGTSVIAVTTYDQGPAGGTTAIPATAHALAGAAATQTLVAGNNALAVATAGTIASLAIGAIAPLPAGSAATVPIAVNARDSDGNLLAVATYDTPIVATLTENGGNGHAQLAAGSGGMAMTATIAQSLTPLVLQYDGAGGPLYGAQVALAAGPIVAPPAAFAAPKPSPSPSPSASPSASPGASPTPSSSPSATPTPSPAASPSSSPSPSPSPAASSTSAAAVRWPSIYVANQGGGFPGSVLVFAPGGTGTQNLAPVATIAGVRTGFAGGAPSGIALDANDVIYVCSYSANTISTFAAHPYGTLDEAPIATIAGNNTGLNYPYSLDLDAAANIYSASYYVGISVFAPHPAGATNVAPTAILAGARTSLDGPTAVAMAKTGAVYVANSGRDTITVYAPHAHGNQAPIASIAGARTGLAGIHALALDAAGRLYVANGSANSITVYAPPGATANVAPIATIAGPHTGLDLPWGLAIDRAGRIFVTNAGNNSITVYAADPSGTLDVAPLLTIAGPATQLSNPLGLAVH
jgi:sugar lactone lactonase YvrE